MTFFGSAPLKMESTPKRVPIVFVALVRRATRSEVI